MVALFMRGVILIIRMQRLFLSRSPGVPEIAGAAIDPILYGTAAKGRAVATPYSVSSWQLVDGLGSNFIYAGKAIRRDEPDTERVVTLSPMTGFKAFADKAIVKPATDDQWLAFTYAYLLELQDFVSRVHLPNGARLVAVQSDANPRDEAALYRMANYEYLSRAEGARNAKAAGKKPPEPARTAEVNATLRRNRAFLAQNNSGVVILG